MINLGNWKGPKHNSVLTQHGASRITFEIHPSNLQSMAKFPLVTASVLLWVLIHLSPSAWYHAEPYLKLSQRHWTSPWIIGTILVRPTWIRIFPLFVQTKIEGNYKCKSQSSLQCVPNFNENELQNLHLVPNEVLSDVGHTMQGAVVLVLSKGLYEMTQTIKFWFLYIVDEKQKWQQYNTTACHYKLYIYGFTTGFSKIEARSNLLSCTNSKTARHQ